MKFYKNKLGGVEITEIKLNRYVVVLNCTAKIPFIYLGIPIWGNLRKIKMWDNILQKLRKTHLNGRYLTFVGRVCLIKAIITPLPLFFLSFFKAPKALIKEIIKIQRQFLWRCGSDEKKIAWVKWSTICKSKEVEELIIKDITACKMKMEVCN